MENSSMKVEAIKAMLLKAGISLAVSVAGYMFFSIVTRKESPLDSLGPSQSDSQLGDEERKKERESEEEIICVRSRMKELQQKVIDLEKRFLEYNDMKEKEMMLIELESKFQSEKSSIELLEREVLGLVTDNQMFESVLLDYIKALEVIELSRSENQSLQKMVKELWKKINRHSSVMKEMSLQIETKEAEISRNHQEIERMINTIQGMEEEFQEMKMTTEQLQGEKQELLDKMDEMTDKSASSSKIDGEAVSMEEYNKVVIELDQVQNKRAEEAKELVFLRWCHACLRHELMRKNQQQHEVEMEGKIQEEPHYTGSELSGFGSDNELEIGSWGHKDDSCLGFSARGHHHSRRRRLIEKFKKWVDGSEKLKEKLDEKDKHEHKLFGKHSVPKGAQNLILPARKSTSSSA